MAGRFTHLLYLGVRVPTTYDLLGTYLPRHLTPYSIIRPTY